MGMRLIYLVLFILLVCETNTPGQNPILLSSDEKDPSIRLPGFFTWNENTVIKTLNMPSSRIVHYQSILDHSNTDFSDRPESLILIGLCQSKTSEQPDFSIRISKDTIMVQAPSEKRMNKALKYLRKLKQDAEEDSPDYGLLYLRCGLYHSKNF